MTIQFENTKICPHCGYEGPGRNKGSVLIEIILWCCYLIPGLIYSIWSRRDTGTKCPLCKGNGMIPTNSPRGRRLQRMERDL